MSVCDAATDWADVADWAAGAAPADRALGWSAESFLKPCDTVDLQFSVTASVQIRGTPWMQSMLEDGVVTADALGVRGLAAFSSLTLTDSSASGGSTTLAQHVQQQCCGASASTVKIATVTGDVAAASTAANRLHASVAASPKFVAAERLPGAEQAEAFYTQTCATKSTQASAFVTAENGLIPCHCDPDPTGAAVSLADVANSKVVSICVDMIAAFASSSATLSDALGPRVSAGVLLERFWMKRDSVVMLPAGDVGADTCWKTQCVTPSAAATPWAAGAAASTLFSGGMISAGPGTTRAQCLPGQAETDCGGSLPALDQIVLAVGGVHDCLENVLLHWDDRVQRNHESGQSCYMQPPDTGAAPGGDAADRAAIVCRPECKWDALHSGAVCSGRLAGGGVFRDTGRCSAAELH